MNSNFVPVFFDLETTGLSDEDDQIIQIGAINEYNDVFCRYVLPSKSIPLHVSQLTGFTKTNNQLYFKGQLKETVSLKTALEDFLAYLRQQGKPVILVAQYCWKFDSRFILRDSQRVGLLSQFRSVVNGFADSLYLFKRHIPGRSSYKQVDLVRDILGPRMVGHEAVADATALMKIFQKKNLMSQIVRFTRTFAAVKMKVDAIQTERDSQAEICRLLLSSRLGD